MADAVGMASGVLALATVAFKASIELHQTIQSFKSHQSRVRNLEGELDSLSGVLLSLTDTMNAPNDVDFSALELPLERCGSACEEFKAELLKWTSRSGGSRTSFRDWTKLKYMGSDIDDFRQIIAEYKATITIAVANATLRNSTVSVADLRDYNRMIRTATEDLGARLDSIDEKMEDILSRTFTGSGEDQSELRRIQRDRRSTQQCLKICALLSEKINQIKLESFQSDESNQGAVVEEPFSEKIMNQGLQGCAEALSKTATILERHMQSLVERMISESGPSKASEEDMVELARLQEASAAARKSIQFFSTAGSDLKGSISLVDNYAEGEDAVQYLVSTSQKTIHGKNRGLAARARQVAGHMSEESLQQLSRDIASISFPGMGREKPPSDVGTGSNMADLDTASALEFGERHGIGKKFTSTSSPVEEEQSRVEAHHD